MGVMVVQQCGYIFKCKCTLKMVKMIGFMLCVFSTIKNVP